MEKMKITTIVALGFILAILFLTFLLIANLAWAHGDAQWIQMNPNFKRLLSEVHCCNPTDCHRTTADIAKQIPGTNQWIAKTGEVFEEGKRGMYDSKDLDWWYCGLDKVTFCLFKPQTAS